MEEIIDRASYRRDYTTRMPKTKKKYIYVILKRLIIQSILSTIVLIAFGVIKLLNIEVALRWIEKDLNKEIDFSEIYNFGQNRVNSFFNNNEDNKEQIIINNIEDEPSILCISTSVPNEIIYETAVEGVNQLAEDAMYITKNYKFDYPLRAPVSSWFGMRESTNPIVTNYHSGIDLAANTGTLIKAALSGEVIVASSSGAYGKHVLIKHDDLVMVYAHLSKINVKVGQKVKQGDKLGEVGSTGQSTGPHLHFEIRFKDRLVNPADILKFSE